jgi:ATP-binding cassette, subfamily B, multidrug efflux pump
MLIRLLRTYLRPHRKELAWVIALQALQSFAALYLPELTADIINRGITEGDTGYIVRHGAWMLVVSAVQMIAAIAAVYVGSRVAAGFGRDVRRGLFHQVTEHSAREVGELGAPSLITRVTNDVAQVQILVQMTCTLLLAAPITAVGGVIMAMREDVGLSVVFAVAIPLLLLIVGNVIARMIPTFRTMQDRIDRMNQVLREQISGIRVVRAFVREDVEQRRFADVNDEVTALGLRGNRLQGLMFPTAVMVTNMAAVAVVWLGAGRIESGDLSPGGLVAYISYLTTILMSTMMATFIAALVPRASVSADRIQEVLDTASTVIDPAARAPVQMVAGGTDVLTFENVSFGYPGAEHAVIDNVSFTCRTGETTAIVGSTGAGKTTLINLAARLYDVTEGSVRLAGVDLRNLALDNLTKHIAVVPQRPYLFSGTVASNLRFGHNDATDEQLWEALAVAQAADFVRAMPGQLDAEITQGGTNVSGGQRQRLAIARALVRAPAVYLFDDSFSALDVATDARLRAALKPYTRDAAVLVVAQRVSTIVNADRIVVLEGGDVVGDGTHADLLSGCDTYAEIVRSQLEATQGVAS